MLWIRTLTVWVLIIAAESVHGILRAIILQPMLGDFRARQVSVFTGCLIILLVTYLMLPWIGATSRLRLLAVGWIWVGLTVAFEIGLGRFVLDLSWERIHEDYDITRGGLLGLGLMFMSFAPLLAAKLRTLTANRSRA